MDGYGDRQRLLAARAAAAAHAAAAYPGIDPASAVAAHAAHLRAAVAAAAAAYPDASSRGGSSDGAGTASASTAVSSSSSSVTPSAVSEASFLPHRFSPAAAALSIGTAAAAAAAAGLPFLNSLFGGSIPPPPPPTSPFRSAHAPLLTMRPFWPPTPPPDTYSRCGGAYLPLLSSPLVGGGSSGDYSPLQMSSRISPASNNSYGTPLFDPHKDVPYLPGTLRLGGASPLGGLHSLAQHSPTSPSPFLHHHHHPSLYLPTPKGYEFGSPHPVANTCNQMTESSTPSPRLKRESMHGATTPNNNEDDKGLGGQRLDHQTVSGNEEQRGPKAGPPLKSISKRKLEECQTTLTKTTPDELTSKEKKPVIVDRSSHWSYPVQVRAPGGPTNNRSKKLSLNSPTEAVATGSNSKCCNCDSRSGAEGSVKVEERELVTTSGGSNNTSAIREDASSASINADLLTPLTIETEDDSSTAVVAPEDIVLVRPKMELVSPDLKTPTVVAVSSPNTQTTTETTTTTDDPSSIQPTEPSTSPKTAKKVSLTSPYQPVTTSSPPTAVTTSVTSSVSTCTPSPATWSHLTKDTATTNAPQVSGVTTNEKKAEVKVTPHIGATPLPFVKSYKARPTNLPASKKLAIVSSETPVHNKTNSGANEAVNLTLSKTSAESSAPIFRSTTSNWTKDGTVGPTITQPENHGPKVVGAESPAPKVTLDCKNPKMGNVRPSPKSHQRLPKVIAAEDCQAVAINLSSKKSSTTNSESLESLAAVSSCATLQALSRLVNTQSLTNQTTEVVSTSWNYRGVQKVKPSSMVSSIQSENINNQGKCRVNKAPPSSLTVTSLSRTMTTSRASSRCATTPETPRLKAAGTPLPHSNKLPKTVVPIPRESVGNAAVLSMRETVSSTTLSVTSSVIPTSGTSSIPVGIAVAQLRQDSSNITVKRTLPGADNSRVSTAAASALLNATANNTTVGTSRPISIEKTDMGDGDKSASHSTTETNILVSQVHCTNSAVNSSQQQQQQAQQLPVTRWESAAESLVRTSLSGGGNASWLAPAPVQVASAPVVTWVGPAPFGNPAPTPAAPTTNLNALEASHLQPGGFQLARDPISGQMFLLPANNIEIVDRSNIWSTFGSQPTVQQIVTQPTAFHQQIIQQVTNGTKTEVKTCTTPQQKKPTFFPAQAGGQGHHLEASARETKEVKVVGAGGLNATVQSTVAGITVQSNQPFTFPGFAATNGVPATLSYFYEAPTILHLTQTQATTAALQPNAIPAPILQGNALRVQATAGIQITNIQQGHHQQQPHHNPLAITHQLQTSELPQQCAESYKRSQATSPLNAFSPLTTSVETRPGVLNTATVSSLTRESADEDDDDTEDSDSEAMSTRLPKRNSVGVTMAIQVDMDASGTDDDNDNDEGSSSSPHCLGKALVQLRDSANQTDTLYSDSAKEDTRDPFDQPEVLRQTETGTYNPLPLSEKPRDALTFTGLKSNVTTPVQTDECNSNCNGISKSRYDESLSQFDSGSGIASASSETIPVNVVNSKDDVVVDETQPGHVTNWQASVNNALPVVDVAGTLSNVPNDEESLAEEGSTALHIEEEGVVVDSSSNPPLLPTKSDMVMDFIDHHGLDLLVDSIEEFASREEVRAAKNEDEDEAKMVVSAPRASDVTRTSPPEAVSSSPPANNYVCDIIDPNYTDGLGILCALAEQRFLEEHKNMNCPPQTSSTPAPTPLSKLETSPHSEEGSLDAPMNKSRVKSVESKEATGKASLSVLPSLTSEDSMDPSEVEMRFKLAELRKKYKEKQRQLAKLKPKKDKEDETQGGKKEQSSSKSRKNRLSIFTSKFGMSFPYVQLPGNNESECNPLESSSVTGSPAKKKRKTTSAADKLDNILSNTKSGSHSTKSEITIGSASNKKNSTSKKNAGWSSRIKSESVSSSTSTCKSSFEHKKTNAFGKSHKNALTTSNVNNNGAASKVSDFANTTVKPQSIVSPRTSSDSEGERLFVQFWTNQRAEKLAAAAAANSAKSRSGGDSSSANESSGKESSPSCSSTNKKSETIQGRRAYAEAETSESEELPPRLKKPKMTLSESKPLPAPQKSVGESGDACVETRKEKRVKVESQEDEDDKSKSKSSWCKRSSGGGPMKGQGGGGGGDSTWNRRRSERIFLHDAGVVLPSTFVLVDEQSNGSISRGDILIEPAKTPSAQAIHHKMKRADSLLPSSACSKKHLNKELLRKRERLVPDELFLALRQCRLSSEGGEAKAITATRTSTNSEESNFSEGDLPLSLLAQKNAAALLPSCILSPDQLLDSQRVITRDEDLYYAGYIKAIQAPDVYGIVLDGERGNKPHIFSREEMLSEAFVEVKPFHTSQIPIGSRVCAYWSQQYRHLYPGTVAKPTSSKHIPDKGMVFVEFDDGDSGRIPLEDIRILPRELPATQGQSPVVDSVQPGDDTGTKDTRDGSPATVVVVNDGDKKNSQEMDATVATNVVVPVTTTKTITDSETEKLNKTKLKKNKKLSGSKSTDKKSSKKSWECDCSPTWNGGSDSSSIIPLSFLKNRTLLKKKSKKNKNILSLSSKNKVARSSGSGKRSSDNNSSSLCATNDESSNSNSGSLSSSTKVKKKKKRKTDRKHRHHKRKHHCHHHHKKHKHDKNRSATTSTTQSTIAGQTHTIIPQQLSSNSDNTSSSSVPGEKIIVSVPVLPPPNSPLATTSCSDVTSMASPERKSELTVKIKTAAVSKGESSVKEEAAHSKSESETLAPLKVKETKPPKEPKVGKTKKKKERQNSVEKSKIAAFLPARQLWKWSGKSSRKYKTKGKGKKEYYKEITRGKEIIKVGDCAVFLSTGRPHLPYVGRIETMWESWGGNMVVKVVWFYHPEETKGGKKIAHPKGALYESSHVDENDVQTISHKCQVISWQEYQKWKATPNQKSSNDAEGGRYDALVDSEDVYYLAGTYDPLAKVLTIAPGVS